jgi:hypothetical protein
MSRSRCACGGSGPLFGGSCLACVNKSGRRHGNLGGAHKYDLQIEFNSRTAIEPIDLERAVLRGLQTPAFGYEGVATVKASHAARPRGANLRGRRRSSR